MAKQIAGLCRLEGTFDQLTFYKMEGQYYVRKKSSLTSKRVKTSDEFRWTMIYARLLARASKIGSAIYKALPPRWRQHWMYRAFTGEALKLLNKKRYTDQEVKQILWKCYVEYWEHIKAADPDNPIWQPKPGKIRKRRVYSLESLLRRKDKNGQPYLRGPEAKEQKRLIEPAIHPGSARAASSNKNPLNLETLSPWHVAHDGIIQTTEKHTTPLYINEECNSS